MSTLGGVRVLDLGWVWAGPLVGAALAELGADVVKVESSRRMDPYRLRGVERRDDLGDRKHEASPSFHKLNRSKRSVTVDLGSPGGRDLLVQLAGRADVLIENFRAGTLERRGLGWKVLHAANPKLVVVSMSAGGQVGRWRELKAYALITTALAGYESVISYDDERPVGGPTFGIADPAVSSFGVLAALAGLHRARRTGVGTYVDMSGVESVIALMGHALLTRGHGGSATGSAGLPLTLPARGGRWVATVATGERDWLALAGRARRTPWPAFAQARADAEARRAATEALEAWSRELDEERLVRELDAAGLRATPVVGIEERNERPPIADLLSTLTHPVTGPEVYHPLPWGAEIAPSPAPLLGQHTDEVLREWLGLEPGRIEALRQSGALS